MKKLIFIIIACLAATSLAMSAAADKVNTVDFVDDMLQDLEEATHEGQIWVIAPNPLEEEEYSLVVGGKTVELGENAIYTKENGTVMVPLRAAAESLGFSVDWNGNEKSVSLDNGEVNTEVYIGENIYFAASSTAIGMSAPTKLGAAPELVNSITYVPAELFEVLYYNVKIENGVVFIGE